MTVISPSEFLPDLPDYPSQGSSTIYNVYPRSIGLGDDGTPKLSYGPISSPSAQYGAINARCQGGTAVRDSSGNTFVFAGDANDLYLLKAGLDTWQNASKSSGAYSTASDGYWNFCYFNGDVIATNFGNTPQYYNLVSSSTFTDLDGGPPRGRYIGVVKNAFVVLGHTYDTSNGEMPQRVWWSAAGNAHNWPTPGTTAAATVESGAVDLLGQGGWVQGFATDLVNADAVVFQEYSIRRMQYAGNPVFDFLPIENAQGTPAPNSIVVRGGIAYYWGQDGIYALDGSASQPIGANRVDKFLFGDDGQSGDVDRGNIFRVSGCLDPLRRLVMWAYPSKQASNGNPDRILLYSWILDKFSLVTDITCETLIRLLSIGYTLDQLYTIFGYTVDTVPAPFDSQIWLGGALQTGLFDANHTMNFLTGSMLEATIEMSEAELVPGHRSLVHGARMLMDISQGGTAAAPTLSIGHRETQLQSVTYSQAFPMNSLGICRGRASGRYVRGKVVIPAASTWTNFYGLEFDEDMVVAQGRR